MKRIKQKTKEEEELQNSNPRGGWIYKIYSQHPSTVLYAWWASQTMPVPYLNVAQRSRRVSDPGIIQQKLNKFATGRLLLSPPFSPLNRTRSSTSSSYPVQEEPQKKQQKKKKEKAKNCCKKSICIFNYQFKKISFEGLNSSCSLTPSHCCLVLLCKII